MNIAGKLAVAAALIALGACSNVTNPIGGGAGGAGGIGGDASTPTRPAYFQQVVGDRVLFEVDQSSLTSTAQSILQGQADWMIANPSYTAIIQGHADEQGTRELHRINSASRCSSRWRFPPPQRWC